MIFRYLKILREAQHATDQGDRLCVRFYGAMSHADHVIARGLYLDMKDLAENGYLEGGEWSPDPDKLGGVYPYTISQKGRLKLAASKPVE